MARKVSQQEQALTESLNALVRDQGGDPDAMSGMLAREVMHTALKLLRDGADDGELKLASRSLKELRYAMNVFRPYRHTRKVSIFGSARTPQGHPDYVAAERFARRMAEHGWMVITGAGDGIMKAGHGGAGRELSFGVAIRLPFETTANEFIEGDRKLVVFRYFFTRKLMFASQSHAVVLFPGGFGTQDEGYEILTLIQTGKAPVVPVVMVDPPGGVYWRNWDRNVRQDLMSAGLVSPEDLGLYMVTDDAQDAADHVLQFYRNYHSQRFVREHLAIRMQRPLTDAQIGALGDEFSDLVAEGGMAQGGPLDGETEHLNLTRLSFISTRRDYGRLRMLIDRINSMDAANHPQRPAANADI